MLLQKHSEIQRCYWTFYPHWHPVQINSHSSPALPAITKLIFFFFFKCECVRVQYFLTRIFWLFHAWRGFIFNIKCTYLKTTCITKDFWLSRSLNTLWGVSPFSKKFGINTSIPIAMWFPVPVPGLWCHYAGKEQGGYSQLKSLLSLKSFWQLFRVYTRVGLSQLSSPARLAWLPQGHIHPFAKLQEEHWQQDWCHWSP